MIGFITKLFGGGLPIIGDILGEVSDHFKNKRELKRAIELAKIERINKIDTADIEWANLMAEASGNSWKDEWFTILFSIPAILAFIPGGDVIVLKGFQVLQQMPIWYSASLGTLVSASVGVPKLVNAYKSWKKK